MPLSALDPKKSKVFLVGMPGCGKSTVGKVLAQQLGYVFLDLDTLVEEQEGLTVPQVFEQHGQAYFREAEARALRQAATRPEQIVLATGGGAPCFCGNMDFMVATGTTVYLRLSPQELVDRLTPLDLQARPLLRDKSPLQLHQYLADTLSQRELFYRRASCGVEAGRASISAVAREIARYITGASTQLSE
ncbi:shikimate kinase [Rufibacter glacialis]|uniref:Shikimate kinase n=1 Tax=Rufibacter glacialis TaxID=1259555 RepID=A0A5M8QB23_9BACT|nr:shikimate kinase [Rufibacter glacialis]KAA6433159.1 shikimate kinase [Rufibacter glacialis]GGK76922.1 shikimate kinase [Rufibacter glacialis]